LINLLLENAVNQKSALIPYFKFFLIILLGSLLVQVTAAPGTAASLSPATTLQGPAPQLPLQCSNNVSNQYCDIRVVLLIDDTGSMRSNDPSSIRDQGAKNLVDILTQEYYQLAVDAQSMDPSVVLPDIKVAVIHFSTCTSINPQYHCSSDVKYNSGWLPITEKDQLYSAIDWLKTQPNYYQVSQYTHFIEPFQAASDLFNDPAAGSNNDCVHRLMMLLTDGTPEDARGPLPEPDLGIEMKQVKSVLQGFLSQPGNSLYVIAFKILPKYWLPAQPYWNDIAGAADHVSLESSLDGVASRMEKIATSIIGATSSTISPDTKNPRQYTLEVLQHVSSLRITYYKLDPHASFTLTDPKGNPVIPDGTTVTQTGKGTTIEVWTLSDPPAGTYLLKASSTEGIITTIPLYAVSVQLVSPTAANPILQFTNGEIQFNLLDSFGSPVLPTDDPVDTLNIDASLVQAGQSTPLTVNRNADGYQASWMPLRTDPAQLQLTLELTDGNKNTLWKCNGGVGDLPIDPVSFNIQPPSACTPVNTILTVPIQVINGRTGQNTGISLPIQWQAASVTQPGGKAVGSSVAEVSAQTGAYELTVKPLLPENILTHVTASVLLNGNPLTSWTYDKNIPITVCNPLPPPPPPPTSGGSCGGSWNYLLWSLLILLLVLLLIRLVLRKDEKKFTLSFWILLILILLLILLWLFLCFDLSLWPLLILLIILFLILLFVRVVSGDEDDRSRRRKWILIILLIILTLLWLIFFGGYWFYLSLMLLILLITLLVFWFIARAKDEEEPAPFWLFLVLLILLGSIRLVFLEKFPGWLVLNLALIWLVILLWLWTLYQERNWRTLTRSWLLIVVFILLVLIWLIYFTAWWVYLLGLLILLLLFWSAAWALYRYSNPLWGVIGIVDRKNRLLWTSFLASPDRSDGRSYYHWQFHEPVGPVRALRIHSWDRLKKCLVLRVTLSDGKRNFIRSLEHWQDCKLEDGYRITWLEKIPERKGRPLPKRKPGSGGGKPRARRFDIIEIEGVGSAYAARLKRLGIRTTDDLLKAAASRKGRRELAGKTGFSTEQILEWVNRADLMRVPGVGSEFSDLLEAGGVDTVKELRRRNPVSLHKALTGLNRKKHLVRRTPSLEEVQAWVASAAKLKAVVKY
jgi:hypothetical protein